MDYNRVPPHLKNYIKPGLNVVQANKALRDAVGVDKQTLYAIFNKWCRNCWAAGRGWMGHQLSACRQAGTPCALECPACGNGAYHWAEDCPKKK